MAVQLQTMRSSIRQRVDMVGSEFITDAEFDAYINASYGELYDLLISKMEDYFVTSTTFTIASGSTSYAVPSGFYKVRGVDRKYGAKYRPMRRFHFSERGSNNQLDGVDFWDPLVQYRVVGSTIYIEPEAKAAGDYKIWYVPQRTTLTNDTDTLDAAVIDDWQEYVIVDCCIKALAKEESDPSVYMAQKQAVVQRIETVALNRDLGEPDSVMDIHKIGTGVLGGYY